MGATEFYGSDLGLAHKFKVEDKKKKFIVGKYLASSWRSLVLFVLERDFTHAWGAPRAVFWGAQAPKCTPVVPGMLLSFGSQSLL